LQPNFISLYLPLAGGVKNIYTALVVIVVLIVYQKKTGNPMVNHEIHFFGALGGIIFTLIMFPHIL
jgi:membrane associated rhomboid family serine protease